MGKKTKMTTKDARRIQSTIDKKGGDKGFKSRAMRAATKHKK
jgi:hypothetical protein